MLKKLPRLRKMNEEFRIVTEKPTGERFADLNLCPYCFFHIRDIINPPYKAVLDFKNRKYHFPCPNCHKYIDYPFCPYEEAFPEKNPHATSCACALGCCNWYHDFCDSKCYETNTLIEKEGNIIFAAYFKEMTRIFTYRVKTYDDGSRDGFKL